MKSDSQLQSEVQTELKWRPSVSAAQIGVAARSGVVTLTGQVAHYTEKAEAESATKGVYGVKAVANDITVELKGSSRRTDAEVAEAALSAMKWDFEVPDDKVMVTVRDGWVTLEGVVDWQYKKDAAERCVRHLMGVAGVTNSITIRPRATSAGVKGKIEEAFRRNADLDARRIGVEMLDGTVTLSGCVSSWSERSAAKTAAWGAPGVTSVDDQLVIVP